MYTSSEDRSVWSYLFHTKSIGDFQITVPQDVEEERGWSYMRDKQFIRVSITQDQTDNGKLIVILSKPFQPEFLCINHLHTKLSFHQWEPARDINQRYDLEHGGLPIVLNPALPKN